MRPTRLSGRLSLAILFSTLVFSAITHAQVTGAHVATHISRLAKEAQVCSCPAPHTYR